MKSKRTLAREYAVQMMYHKLIVDEQIDDIIRIFWMNNDAEKKIRNFAEELFTLSCEDQEFNDELVKKYLKKGWVYERLGEIEKSIFRVGVAELLKGSAPVYAILDDYVSIASKFMDEKSASLVNGILDTVKGDFQIDRNDR